MTLDTFFAGQSNSRQIFEAVCDALEDIGSTEIHVTRSQIAFKRRKTFAWVWRPGQYLKGNVAPLVLTLSFRHRDASPRWKEIVEPVPGRFTHHLELYSSAEVDAEVCKWLSDAWTEAG